MDDNLRLSRFTASLIGRQFSHGDAVHCYRSVSEGMVIQNHLSIDGELHMQVFSVIE